MKAAVIGYVAGAASVVLAAILVGSTILSRWNGVSVSGPFAGSAGARTLIGVEFLLLVIAAAAFLLAEFSRRGALATREGGLLGVGTNTVSLRRISTPVRLLWMLVPILLWAGMSLVPLALAFSGPTAPGEPIRTGPAYDSGSVLWLLITVNAAGAAGAFGAMLASLVKALAYDHAARRGVLAWNPDGTLLRPRQSSGLWTALAYHARLDLIAGFIATAALGCLPFALAETGPERSGLVLASVVTAVIAGACALLVALNAWRSGRALTAGESLAAPVRLGDPA